MKRSYKKLSQSQKKAQENRRQSRIIIAVIFTIILASYAINIMQQEPLLFALLVILVVALGIIIRLIIDYYGFLGFQYYSTIEKAITMDPRDFEHYVCKVMSYLGYQAQVRSWNQDGWVDIDAYKNNIHTIVQCKRYNPKNKLTSNISVMAIRELYGVARATWARVQCLFVTTSDYSNEAINFAKHNNIELWNGNSLVEALSQIGMIKTYDHFFDRLVNHKFK